MAGRVLPRRDTAAALAGANLVFLDGELVQETDSKKFKMGDGVTAYNSLPYIRWVLESGDSFDTRLAALEGAGVGASDVLYDNATSGLVATNAQAALDEVADDLATHVHGLVQQQQQVNGIAWYQAGAAAPDSYQALNDSGGDAGALVGNTGYARQTDVVPVNPFPQSRMRRCVLADDGGSVVYYLDTDDSTKRAGAWLRVHEGVNDPVHPIPGQATTGSATLRAGLAAWAVNVNYVPGSRVVRDGKVWECLTAAVGDEPAAGTAAADLTGADGQVMVEVPRFHVWNSFDVGTNRHAWEVVCDPATTGPFPDLTSDGTSLAADVVVGGRTFTVHPAFVRAGVQRSHRYISAFRAHDNAGTLRSVAGQTPTHSLTRANFRTRARARNVGLTDPSGNPNDVWSLVDWPLWAAIQLLLLTEFRTFHSQAVLGAGNIAGGDYGPVTGRSAPVGNGSGVHDAAGALQVPHPTNDFDGVVYRGIEDVWGTAWQWIDGWNCNERDYLVCLSPSDVADDTAVGYVAVGTAPAASSSYPDSITGGLWFVPQSVAGSSSTHLPDGHWNSTGWRVARVGAIASDGVRAGAWAVVANIDSSVASVVIGAALAR